ncbi:alpha-L-fucosidase [Streptomyces litchfieldiae]|uniref:alpha-L-fucosidase n=1 Tax=Streptomyces litchfieldiae TaxID=3075543 RepID=A0ABU2MX15_9ACTN|nr:alpha-L-fucosidase [Streptomyces sp. DSM 44938]MDT0346159.1 alpha-L-fucosidase [Streptomyces sp. DSM 44938]
MTGTHRESLPGWVKEASLGIFIHWGPYAVPAWAEPEHVAGEPEPEGGWFKHCSYAEWYANTIRIEGSPAAAHHAEVHGSAPYEDFLDQWKAEAYDPAAWARLFRALGADYVVPVTKHHDGVTLWDAPGSDGFNTVDRGPKRDLLGPLAEAVRAEGMRFGVYYSGGLDWSITDYPPIVEGEDIWRFRPNDAAYAAYATAHVRDLIDRYAPSVLWNDIEWPEAGKEDGSLVDLIAHYRDAVPDGIVNDRWGADVWDYRTSEYSMGADHETGSGWEHNRGLGSSFGYNRVEDESFTLSPRELAKHYADVVSRGGRLLLNVGPDAAGRIPDVQVRTLEGAAAWMTGVKPYTTDRRFPGDAEVTVSAEADNWYRTWASGDKLVVIADRPEAVRVTAPGYETVAIALPEQER